MCGIFGTILWKTDSLGPAATKVLIKNLFLYSESRGKESSGLALYDEQQREILLAKSAISAGNFLKTDTASKILGRIPPLSRDNTPLVCMGHSRLVTNGAALLNENNQPVKKGDVVLIHNGIITNVSEIWSSISDKRRKESDVDTEAFGALTDIGISSGNDAASAVTNAFSAVKGAASIALMSATEQSLVLATNTGSLYVYSIPDDTGLVFASETFILKQALNESGFDRRTFDKNISQIPAFSGLRVSITKPEIEHFKLSDVRTTKETRLEQPFKVLDLSTTNPTSTQLTSSRARGSADEKLLEFNIEEILKIKRCSHCVLPETFPFIHFNHEGVCNYCLNYKKKLPAKAGKLDDFLKQVEPYRNRSSAGDCVVAFSGGRDSSYGLHYLCKETGLKPITYTYDWGMVTDLARRNIARITGKLGVENILVSADIKMKRRNIRMNVVAWLRRPNLGMVPLFMAGDKQFIKYGNIVKRQTGIPLDIWLPNQLENTDFKSGFCGIQPFFEKEKVDQLTLAAKLQMPLFYLKSFAGNPGYLNTSLLDTAEAYWSYYIEKRDPYVRLYDFIRWDEKQIDDVIIGEYDWEIAEDTETTWRIGDGTAPFYNYIYFTVAGFSENETFRSNQIREGDLTREEALRLIVRDNRPRYQSLKWYFDTIGIEFDHAIKVVNSIPKLYRSAARTSLSELSPRMSI